MYMFAPVVIFLALMPLLGLAMATFNRLVHHLSQTQPKAWEAAGRPLRFYEAAWGPGTLRRSWISQAASISWLFRTPSWAQHDPVAQALLRRYRVLVATFNVGVILNYGILMLTLWAG